MAINKIVYGNETLIDLTEDTATESDVASGAMFHLANGVRTTGTAKYASAPVANGNADKSNAILFGRVDSTSTATVFTATVDGLTELVDGTAVYLTNHVVTSASGFTINVNGLGAKKVYNNLTNATRDTTIFNVSYSMLFIYDSKLDSNNGGWWCYRGYDSNTATAMTDAEVNTAVDDAFVVDGYTVEITLTNPLNPEKFTYGAVDVVHSDDVYDTGERLATISSPTQSLTVVVPQDVWGIRLILMSSFPGFNISNATCTGGVSLGSHYESGIVLFRVTGDGSIVADRVDYYDD